MKRIFLVIAFALTASLTTIAQTPRIDKIMKEQFSWTGASYRACVDSLSRYIIRRYGGSHLMSYATNEVIAPVRGNDDKLRKVMSHVKDRLSELNVLQTYSELIDDSVELRGRMILKLQPEGNDTNAYILAKYNRNTIILRLQTNQAVEIPTSQHKTNSSWKEDELSLWKKVRREFYSRGSHVDRDVQMKWCIGHYDEEHPFFVTTPAPVGRTDMLWQLIHINDSTKWFFHDMKDLLELAGKEENSTYGVLTNNISQKADSCHYYYAYHTKPNGQAELIGVTHENDITYFVRATNDEPTLSVIPWGKTIWEKEQESETDNASALIVFLIDEATNKTVKDAKLTFMKADKKTVIKKIKYEVQPTGERKIDIYRHLCFLPPHDRYMLKVEAEGYKTAWKEITPDPNVEKGKVAARVEVLLQSKR